MPGRGHRALTDRRSRSARTWSRAVMGWDESLWFARRVIRRLLGTREDRGFPRGAPVSRGPLLSVCGLGSLADYMSVGRTNRYSPENRLTRPCLRGF